MRVAVTGTPGTGKTTATDLLETDLDVIHLNEVITSEEFSTDIDEERGSLVADMDALAEWLDGREDVIVESHLAHNFGADRVVVLRAHPDTVVSRLRGRGDSDAKARENAGSTEPPRALTRKARENAESEALDVILSEAVHHHGTENVYEIDTTDRDPGDVAAEIAAVVAGEREPSAGTVSYVDWL
ncbi:adenylate kinase [Halobacteriales archaeon QH_8_67_36]|nr:MAG: adenylate kinase [Halobacteriales archaeon QH_8_67_36]